MRFHKEKKHYLPIAVVALLLTAVFVYSIWRFLQYDTKGRLLESLKVTASGKISFMNYHSDGSIFLSGYEDGYLEVFDLRSGDKISRLKAHDYRVSQLAFSSYNNVISSSSHFDKNTKIWSYPHGDLVDSIPDSSGPEKFYKNSNVLILASGSKLKIYDTELNEMDDAVYDCKNVIHSLSISKEGNYLAAGTNNGICVWKIRENEVSLKDRVFNRRSISLEPFGKEELSGLKDWVVGVEFSDNERHLYATLRGGSIVHWHLGFAGNKKTCQSRLRHIAQSLMVNDSLVNMGVVKSNGVGLSRVEIIKGDCSSSILTVDRFRTYAPMVSFEPENRLVIANSGKYYSIYLSDTEENASLPDI